MVYPHTHMNIYHERTEKARAVFKTFVLKEDRLVLCMKEYNIETKCSIKKQIEQIGELSENFDVFVDQIKKMFIVNESNTISVK